MNQEEITRMEVKTAEHRYLDLLKTEFGFSTRMAEELLEEAKRHLLGKPEQIKLGQQRVILVSRKARHGSGLSETDKVEVIWTIDEGKADLEELAKRGPTGLRRHRIQRLLQEAVEQGAVATQEDLAKALQVTPRTIQRDFAALKESGKWLPSRGYLRGIGRGQTHKAAIIGRWLRGETYDQLVVRTHHSLASIRRYIQSFMRVLQLHERGFENHQIALLAQMGEPLVAEYLEVYQQNNSPACRERLGEQLQRLGQRKVIKKRALP
jgi:hypothetical protein